MSCDSCQQASNRCICEYVDEFFANNRYLMEDLLEIEAMEKPGAKRCLACYWFDCRCVRGLRAKNDQTNHR